MQAPPDPQPPQPNPGPSYPASASRIRFERIGDAFRMVFADLSTWAIAGLIAVIPLIVVAILTVFFAFFAILGAGFFGFWIAMLIRNVLMMAVTYIMLANMLRMAFTALAGMRPSVNEMLRFTPNVTTAGLIYGAAVGVGMSFFLIPGLIIGGLWLFMLPLVLERNLPPMQAASESLSILKNDLVMATLFFLAVTFCGFIGVAVLGFGAAITLPVIPLAVAMVYRDHIAPASIVTPPAPPAV